MGSVDAVTDGAAVLTADAIATQLREHILTGALPVGLRWKQEALAARFGVSRFPIRLALKRLEAEGLVQHKPFERKVAGHAMPICDGIDDKCAALVIAMA